MIDEIVGTLARRHSTATVLFHHAVAERLGLGPSDHKCLDLIRDRGPTSATEIAGLAGLSSGAVSGVVARLLEAGFVVRAPDPEDGRRQVLSISPLARSRLGEVFGSQAQDTATALAEAFNAPQLEVVAEFLRRATEFTLQRTALLRAQTSLLGPQRKGASHNTNLKGSHGLLE